jgi:hypothetical protein
MQACPFACGAAFPCGLPLLHLGGIRSPLDALRAAIVAEHKE